MSPDVSFTVVYTTSETHGTTLADKSLGALNTIHRRRDLLAGVYLGAVVTAVIVRLYDLPERRLCLVANITEIYRYFAGMYVRITCSMCAIQDTDRSLKCVEYDSLSLGLFPLNYFISFRGRIK